MFGGEGRQAKLEGKDLGGRNNRRKFSPSVAPHEPTPKTGSPKPTRFRQRFGYFAAEGKVTRAGARNISMQHPDKLQFVALLEPNRNFAKTQQQAQRFKQNRCACKSLYRIWENSFCREDQARVIIFSFHLPLAKTTTEMIIPSVQEIIREPNRAMGAPWG